MARGKIAPCHFYRNKKLTNSFLRRGHMQKTLKKYFVIFTVPTLLAFSFAFVIPFIMGVYMSFCEFTTVDNAKFVGIENYVKAFVGSSSFMSAFGFTVKFVIVAILVVNLGAFGLAMLLTKKIRGTNIFRTVFFMPNLIGGIVLGYTWQQIGYMMIIYIAGLQNVPTDLIEAAKIDGATGWQTLKNVTIPMVMPSITVCTFLTLSNSFKLYDQNLALTAGAPSHKTEMLALNIVDTFYGRTGFQGVGQAKAVVFFIIVAVVGAVQLVFTRNKEVDQ